MNSMSFVRELKGLIKLNLKFKTVTGLLIRRPITAQAYRIGGADQYPMVTRKKYGDKELEVPYVPGSSIKGRMRSLLELAQGLKLYSTDKKIWQHVRNLKTMGQHFFEDVLRRCIIDELFGWASTNYEQIADAIEDFNLRYSPNEIFRILAPTRLLTSDFTPSEDCVKRLDAKSIADFVEEKSENRIDRVTSAADPRSIIRVKPEIEFEGNMTILLFDNDKDMVKKYLQTLVTGLQLIESTYLGGCGSRGYGRVKFHYIEVVLQKVVKEDGTPVLKDTGIRKEYHSLDEMAVDLDALSQEIIKEVYGS